MGGNQGALFLLAALTRGRKENIFLGVPFFEREEGCRSECVVNLSLTSYPPPLPACARGGAGEVCCFLPLFPSQGQHSRKKKVPTVRKHSVSLTRQNFISVGDFDHLLPFPPFLYAAPPRIAHAQDSRHFTHSLGRKSDAKKFQKRRKCDPPLPPPPFRSLLKGALKNTSLSPLLRHRLSPFSPSDPKK